MDLQKRDQRIRQDGEAVVFSLTIPHKNLMVAKVDILDAQTKTFHKAQSAAIEYFRH
jgi:hypothetical protein